VVIAVGIRKSSKRNTTSSSSTSSSRRWKTQSRGTSIFSPGLETYSTKVIRVHSHAAAALVNFCEGVEHDTLVPYIDPIFERLLKLLAPGENKVPTKRYVQEQAITSLAMVADASEKTFVKVSLSRLYAEEEEC
jgi:hypothetical protein